MPNPDKPSWMMRRCAIFGLLAVCAFVIVYVVGWGEDTQLHRQALMWGFVCSFLTVLSYAGLATIEDISIARVLGAGR